VVKLNPEGKMKLLKVLKSRNGKAIDFEKVESEIEKVSRKFGILLFYVFGSYAFGKAYKLSDLDLAFLSINKFVLRKRLALLNKLQTIFEEEAIDLIDLNTAPLTLVHRIFKEGKCLYAQDLRTKIEFETKCEVLYFDTEPLRKEYSKALTERIKDGSFGYR
jgi:predicted nucleotidyltransferase